MATRATDEAATAETSTATTITATADNITGFEFGGFGGMGFGGPCRGHGGGFGGFGGFMPIEVSAEFEAKVTSIAENDTDVQALLAEGYNVTSIRPVVKTVVDADGVVTTKATSAILMLLKDTSGCASVYVDIEQGKVTQIVIMTRTVIDKTSS